MKADQIQICDLTIYNGRNIYSHRPVMKMAVNIGKFENTPTNGIPGFHEKLLRMLPGLKTNSCGLGYEGGFLTRLKEGTYLAHVLEHVILEMQFMLGYGVRYGKTRRMGDPSFYYLVYEFENEVCGLECGKAAVFILNCLLSGEDIEIGEFLEYLKKVSEEAELGPSTSAIVAEAKKREIPITRIGSESLVRLGYGRHSRLIESTLTDATSCICADISCNKQLTKFILKEHKIPVPYGKIVYSEISALMAANQIGKPVVIKPFNGNQGKGVFLNLKDSEEIKAAFREASRYSNGIIVEKYVRGRDFRILVVKDKVSAAAQRLPASVTGDGLHTVSELVDIENRNPDRGEHHERKLTKIRLDQVALNILQKNSLSASSVPSPGEVVVLRDNGNLSTGGIAVDCTETIHPDNAEIAVRAANAIGIDIAGIDIVTDDISQSIWEKGGAVVEVNTAPGIRMHLYPSVGKPRDVARDILDLLFPDEQSVRFPVVSVTGTNGKTTVVRLISHILSQTGMTVGMTTTSGSFVKGKCICRGDNSGPVSARCLLSNKSIDAAVLETARGGIIREGLGYDLADVGVITNIAEDHLGADGVETLSDLVFVKSLVAEAVKKDGRVVLNGQDKATPLILERVKARPVLFYRDQALIRDFHYPDCARVFVEKGRVVIQEKDRGCDLLSVCEIPLTCGGRISCNIENALAATAAAHSLGIPKDLIVSGLKSFSDNAGRFQLYDLKGVRVMLDYGHNLPGYEEVIKSCEGLDHTRLIGVIGMPGDRKNEAVESVGRRCAEGFCRLYIKEDADLRGRKKGEVAKLLFDAAVGGGCPPDRIMIAEDELSGLKAALLDSEQGDLIVVFYEKLEPLQRYLTDLSAKRIQTLS